MSKEDDINPQRNLRRMYEYGPLYAQAKATRMYLEEFRKSLKAKLMKDAGDMAIGAQEREAYAHPDYATHLEGMRVAVEQEELYRWKLETAKAAIEVWRSQEASNRNMDKAAA
jgi:hypothetical protein